MKKLSIFAGAISLASATSSLAGGTVAPVVEVQPVVVAPANLPTTWTGGYVGANINYGQSELEAVDDLSDFLSDEGLSSTLAEPDGTSAAIRAGYDWQAGRGVFGLGAEYNVGKYEGGLSGEYGDALDFVGASADIEVKNAATIFARAGYLVNDSFLAYGLLGYTRAKAELSASFEGETESGSETLSGATFGIGGEYKFGPRWSAYAEYAYTDFGDLEDTDGQLEADLSQVKFGANFRF